MRGIGVLILVFVTLMLLPIVYSEPDAIPLSGNAAYTQATGRCSPAGGAEYGLPNCMPRTIGWWMQVCAIFFGKSKGNEGQHTDAENLQYNYMPFIKSHSTLTDFQNLNSVSKLCGFLTDVDQSRMIQKAKQQLMALWLNVASEKLCLGHEVKYTLPPGYPQTVLGAIQYIEYTIKTYPNDQTKLETAKNLADGLNNGNYLPCVSLMHQEECTAGSYGCSEVTLAATTYSVDPNKQVSTSSISDLVVNFYDASSDGCAYNKDAANVYSSCAVLSSCITDDSGKCSAQLTNGMYLAAAKTGDIYISSIVNNDMNNVQNNAELFLVEYSYTDDKGSLVVNQVPAKKTKLKGSELDILEPEYLKWVDGVKVLCPFIFTTQDTWLVNVELKVPNDVMVINSNSQDALLMNETKIVMFEITETPKLTGSSIQTGLAFNAVIKAAAYHGDSEKLVKQIVEQVLAVPENTQLPAQVDGQNLETIKERITSEVQPSASHEVSEVIVNVYSRSITGPSILFMLLLLGGIVLISYYMKKR